MTEEQGAAIIALLTQIEADAAATYSAVYWCWLLLAWIFGLLLVCGGWALWSEFMEGRRMTIDVPTWRDEP